MNKILLIVITALLVTSCSSMNVRPTATVMVGTTI